MPYNTFYLILLFVVIQLCNMEPKYEYNSALDAMVVAHYVPANFLEARLRCHLEEGTLLSPLSDSHVAQIEEIMKDKPNKTGPIMTGLSDVFSQGDYFSVEGKKLELLPDLKWEVNELVNAFGRARCIGFIMETGTLTSVDCNKPLQYACYRTQQSSADCGLIGYEFTSVTSHCYKFHTRRRTYSRAFMKCEADGAYLAIVNDEHEGQYLSGLYKRSEPAMRPYPVAFIGFNDLLDHGNWITVHGQTLKDAGYTKWNKGEPDNGSDKFQESCGAIMDSSALSDRSCDIVTFFICEKIPGSD